MNRTGPIQDVFACAVPERVDMQDPRAVAALPDFLTTLATEQAWAQYAGRQQPSALEFEEIDWLITQEPSDVEKFQPAHDCAACRAGNDQTLAFLRDHPGQYIALANLTYTEIW